MIFPDIPADICDIYSEEKRAIGSFFTIDTIIQILRVITIYRNYVKVATIAPAFILFR